MSTEKQTAAQRRRSAIVARLALVRHWLLGNLAVRPVPGTVFDPRAFFLDPARLPAILNYWAERARRDGCGAGLPRRLRDAACEQAAQACLTYFMDADYARRGLTGDEFARAVLRAYRIARRAFWRDTDAHRDAQRERRAVAKGWRPWNRAQNSRTPDPARIVHASDALGQDVHAVTGEGMADEIPGDTVTVPGGPSGRGETDGRMECVTVRDRAVNVAGGAFCRDRLALSIIDTRWRMVRGRGRAQRLPACTVREGIPAPRPVFRPGAIPGPVAGLHRDGLTTARPTVPLPPVTPADALYSLRRLGRGLDGAQARREVAQALRRLRAAMR